MLPPNFEEWFVAPTVIAHRLALIAALFAALGLSACGRKGALDPPPAAATSDVGETVNQSAQGGDVERYARPGGLPTIRGPEKRIPLDALLD
jgi:predicted small lipoprotein YifL